MNPTNESIGRPSDDEIIRVGLAIDKAISAQVKWAGTLNRDDVAIAAIKALRKLDRKQFANNRQAPGVPDWQSVADQMAAAIAPGEWVMVPRELRKASDMWEAGVRARNRGGTVHDVWDAMLAAAPQPPAQEQGEVETLARRLELEASALIGLLGRTDDSSDVRVMRDAATALRGRLHQCTMGVGDGSGQLFVHGSYEAIKACQALVTRAAGAEDARDAALRLLYSKDLYGMLMDVQNGIDSPASASIANSLIRRIDASRDAAIASQAKEGESNG